MEHPYTQIYILPNEIEENNEFECKITNLFTENTHTQSDINVESKIHIRIKSIEHTKWIVIV